MAFRLLLLIGSGLYIYKKPLLSASNNDPTTQTIAPFPSAPASEQENLATIPDTSPAYDLELALIAADSGMPVPSAQIKLQSYIGGYTVVTNTFQTNPQGNSRIKFPQGFIDILLTTVAPGFADTRIAWNLSQGDQIPNAYIARLKRAQKISGIVIDPKGNPVYGAKVVFSHSDNPRTDRKTENHNFAWIQVESDMEGRWEINRVALEMLPRLLGGARHEMFQPSDQIRLEDNLDAAFALTNGSHVFRLKSKGGFVIAGRVKDSWNNPIANAKILLGRDPSGATAETGADGTFYLEASSQDSQLLTATATNYAPTAKWSNTNSSTTEITMADATFMAFLVKDLTGSPVTNATLHFRNFGRGLYDEVPYIVKRLKSDSQGRAYWSNAPALSLYEFDVSAPDYMRMSVELKYSPTAEYVITLLNPFRVHGTVLSADSHQEIPEFILTAGRPLTDYRTGKLMYEWPTISRFTTRHRNGAFDRLLVEPITSGLDNKVKFVFKIEADGYEPFISDVYPLENGEAKLDLLLHRGKLITILVSKSNGAPISSAQAALIGPSGRVIIKRAGFENAASLHIIQGDKNGRFSFIKPPLATHFVISTPNGFIEAPLDSLTDSENEHHLTLQPLANLEGILMRNGRVLPNGELMLQRTTNSYAGLQLNSNDYRAVADQEGRFSISNVPPGLIYVIELITNRTTDPTIKSFSYGRSQPVNLEPGKTTRINFPAF